MFFARFFINLKLNKMFFIWQVPTNDAAIIHNFIDDLFPVSFHHHRNSSFLYYASKYFSFPNEHHGQNSAACLTSQCRTWIYQLVSDINSTRLGAVETRFNVTGSPRTNGKTINNSIRKIKIWSTNIWSSMSTNNSTPLQEVSLAFMRGIWPSSVIVSVVEVFNFVMCCIWLVVLSSKEVFVKGNTFLLVRCMLFNDFITCLYNFGYHGWHLTNLLFAIPEVKPIKRCFYVTFVQIYIMIMTQTMDMLIAVDRLVSLVSPQRYLSFTVRATGSWLPWSTCLVWCAVFRVTGTLSRTRCWPIVRSGPRVVMFGSIWCGWLCYRSIRPRFSCMLLFWSWRVWKSTIRKLSTRQEALRRRRTRWWRRWPRSQWPVAPVTSLLVRWMCLWRWCSSCTFRNLRWVSVSTLAFCCLVAARSISWTFVSFCRIFAKALRSCLALKWYR